MQAAKARADDMSANPACPSCGASASSLIGDIPPSTTFAGRDLGRELDGACLWRCNACHMLYRFPRLGEAELGALYQSGNIDSWDAPVENRTDWLLIRQWLSGHDEIRKILDVGCFDGRLLEYLGGDYQLYGVEIHEQAAERAAARGVEVVGRDFGQLGQLDLRVDAVLAVDVIEHSLDPKSLLSALADCVDAGGYILLTTGNTDAVSWRFMGSHYWYCHIAEHISFVNPDWVRGVASELDLEPVSIQKFSHLVYGGGIVQKIYELLVNSLLRFAPGVFAWLRRRGIGGIDVKRFPGLAKAPPYWMTARDHMFVVLKKCNR